MADSADDLKSCSDKFLLENENFERGVKERLKWSQQMWIDKGEVDNKMKKLTNSIRFWSTKLAAAQRDSNIIIGLYNAERNVSVSLVEVLNELDILGVSNKLKGFNSFKNPRFMNFTFDSKETKLLVQKNLRRIGESYVVYLEWGLCSLETVVKVHWVPADFMIESIISILADFVIVNSFAREEQKMLDGRSFANGTIMFKTELRPSVHVKDIPHLCEVEGLEFLVNVTGRDLLCLNCNKLGHKSSECSTPFCLFCKKMQERQHECPKKSEEKLSYALKVVGGNEAEESTDVGFKTVLFDNKKKPLFSKEENERMLAAKNFWSTNELQETVGLGLVTELKGSKKNSASLGNFTLFKGDTKEVSDNSDGSISDSENTDMSQFRDSLLKLNSEAAENVTKMKELMENGKDSIADTDTVQTMDVDDANLKRKMNGDGDSDNFPGRSTGENFDSLWNSNVKTYGRGGGKRGSRGSFLSDNLFQALVDGKK